MAMKKTENIGRRQALALLGATLGGHGLARASSFPDRPVTIVVPFSAGGSTDVVARLVAARLQQRLGQSFIVDNRGGAGGNIGATAAARARPDGYTVLYATLSLLVFNEFIYTKMPFRSDELTPLALTVKAPLVMCTATTSGVQSLTDLLDRMRRAPGGLSYASAGSGSASHVAASMLLQQQGLAAVHVPYKGSGPAANDLLSNTVAFCFDSPVVYAPHIKAGTLKGLAVTGPQRIPTLPDVPTFAQVGLPNFDASTWNAWMAPAGTPPAIADLLAREIQAVHAEAEFRARLAEIGAVSVSDHGPQQTAQFIAQEKQRWKPYVVNSGAKVD